MKALIKDEDREGLELKDIPKPELQPMEVLIEVKTAGICGSDIHLYRWDEQARAWNPPLPIIIGHEFSGEVIKIGRDVRNFKVGDRVAADSHIPCMRCRMCKAGLLHICENMKLYGIQTKNGAFAEYAAAPETILYKLPSEISFDDGALLEPFGVAMHAIERAEICAGDVVVVLGCGPIGLFIQEIAHLSGAIVIATDVNDIRLNLSKKLGTKFTFNPIKENIKEVVTNITDGKGADVVFEVAGTSSTIQQSFDLAAKNGKVALVGLYGKPVEIDVARNIIYKELIIIGTTGRHMFKTWERMVELLKRKLVEPQKVVTHQLPLEKYEEGFQAIFNGEAVKVLLKP
jgi:threonine 3-dehydrogenase